ncbi:lysophospholipid acyltransferase family protein [Draconibacterium sp. IB214405]|uniref:lysophospholipid acyltransferase family protein n=1 Tax=Draconibacterium sp. IB214405 TaxID=3097352 RepID=UPI002A13C788|nr:lysophospholipid acyltransferase family protein [Draconibacterium sp. IB214405]MDX8338403.1 lysophospholipid acyltransferase family protein [Draconibacterium sp. IB214405]
MSKKKIQNQKSSGFFSNPGKWTVVVLLKAIALLPFGCLYFLSDVLYVVIKALVKYRSNVITENLKHAFPEKSENEILILRNKFYRYFCDVSLESIKLYHLSEKQLQKRITFSGTEELDAMAKERNGAILLAFHYNNWEWSSALQQQLTCRLLMVYNKMRDNAAMDDFLQNARQKWGGEAVQMGRAAKVAFQYFGKTEPVVLGLIADQSALASSQLWAMFMNREAAFFAGPVKIARKTNQPVFFQYAQKLGRGKYQYHYELLVEEPAKMDDKEILLRYIEKMEEVIKSNPEYYLWSHKRWKHKRPEGTALIQ